MKPKAPEFPAYGPGHNYCDGPDGQRLCTGAKHGRPDCLGAVSPEAVTEVSVRMMKMFDGDYDESGCYWGGTGPGVPGRWWEIGNKELGILVVRDFGTRQEAVAEAFELFPNAKVFSVGRDGQVRQEFNTHPIQVLFLGVDGVLNQKQDAGPTLHTGLVRHMSEIVVNRNAQVVMLPSSSPQVGPLTTKAALLQFRYAMKLAGFEEPERIRGALKTTERPEDWLERNGLDNANYVVLSEETFHGDRSLRDVRKWSVLHPGKQLGVHPVAYTPMLGGDMAFEILDSATQAATMVSLAAVVKGYLDAVYWCECGPDAEFDRDSNIEMSLACERRVWDTCRRFLTEAQYMCNLETIAGQESRIGYDFYMTRSRSGTGFWDRDDWPTKEKWDALASRFVELSVGFDDNTLYLE